MSLRGVAAGADRAVRGPMLPRAVIPGRITMITRRCAHRELLLRPDDETNEIFLYVLAVAAARTGVQVILPSVQANHHHTVTHDPLGRLVEFYEHLHKLVARAMNVHRGRFENFWASEQTSVVELVGVEDIVEKIVYAATNPVKDGLVARVHHWPGVNGLRALLERRTITVKKPRIFFREGGDLPDEVTLTLGLPPELGDPGEILATIERRVAEVEAAVEAERAETGARVMGRRAVRLQSWRTRPRSDAPRFGMRPRVAARNRWARAEAVQRNREFLDAYRAARALWLEGQDTRFPSGTYWLRRFANVPVVPHARGPTPAAH
jgi:putative transposase